MKTHRTLVAFAEALAATVALAAAVACGGGSDDGGGPQPAGGSGGTNDASTGGAAGIGGAGGGTTGGSAGDSGSVGGASGAEAGLDGRPDVVAEAGGGGLAGDAADGGCVAEGDTAFCTRLGKTCGSVTAADNCGTDRTTSCGTCTPPQTCSASNVCACTAETDATFCTRLGKNCGSVTAADNCGTDRTIPCGTCTAPTVCGGSNVCGCTAEADAAFCTRQGKNCGSVTAADNCGATRTVGSCGTCSGTGVTCGGGPPPAANVCGCTTEADAAFCTRLGKNCGSVTGADNCGATRTVASCGTCSGTGESCGGGVTPAANVCGCAPEADAAFCTRVGKNCDSVTAADNCGTTRTVSSCGTCSGTGETCGGGVTPVANVCGCAPENDGTFCSRNGKNCGSFTANDNCGVSRIAPCGNCIGAGSTCGGGSNPVANVCGCISEADDAFCTRLGKNCGNVTAADNCGVPRTVSSCGACAFPLYCQAGSCAPPASCNGLAATCGVDASDAGADAGTNTNSCCATSQVTGGAFNRSNDATYPATVSDFALDLYEITVSRFRNFVAAYPANLPAAGAGKNPHNTFDPGWDATWNTDGSMPADQTALLTDLNCDASFQTWTDSPAGNETLPVNCITWYEAFAFCAWDGGRLPTEAEWNYAAAGGSEQRKYPWGATDPGSDADLAVYGCYFNGSGPGTCAGTANIASVGSIPAGVGKWGQADMAGNLWEWVVDWSATYTNPCQDCSNTNAGSSRTLRGGSFQLDATRLVTSYRGGTLPSNVLYYVGARCARSQ